jgi:predicted phosphodiesterase
MSEAEEILQKRNLTTDDLTKILNQLGSSQPTSEATRRLPFSAPRVRFTCISDTHMGHKLYRPDILEHAIRTSKRFGSEFWVHPGDILEGMSGREGHVYELNVIGASNQLDYAVQQLKAIERPIFGITATNSHDGWYSSKNNAGFEVGPELQRRLPNFNFLGYDEADLELDNGLKIRLVHPGDGVAYALSYKGQRYLNSLSGGKKPDVALQGHYHKSMYMFYRNVHFIDAATLCGQTTFMKKKGTPAMMGYWLLDVRSGKKGVESIKPTFVPFYDDKT